MGLFSRKTKTTQQSTATTAPNVPDWILKPYQESATAVGSLQTQDPSSFAPTSTPTLNKVWGDAGNLTTGSGYDDAAGMVRGVGDVKASSLLDGFDNYRDKYFEQVRRPVLNDFDVNAGKTRAAQAVSGARNGGFRGARFGLREAATEGELSRARASVDSGLLDNSFRMAAEMSGADAGRRQQTDEGNASRRYQGAGLLADITGRMGSEARSNLDMRGRFASQEADLGNVIRQFPIEYQQKIQGLLSGLNGGMFTGQTVNSSGTGTSKANIGLGSILKAIGVGAS